MGGTYTNSAALFAAIQKEMKSAMTEASLKSFLQAHENAQDFYSQGDPKRYNRTGTYGTAPDTTGVTGGGNHLETEIYMNPDGHGYSTGSFSAQQVWEAAEDHTFGVLGKSGRWKQTEDDTKKIFHETFSEHFE